MPQKKVFAVVCGSCSKGVPMLLITRQGSFHSRFLKDLPFAANCAASSNFRERFHLSMKKFF